MLGLNTFETLCRGKSSRVPLPDKQTFPIRKMFQGNSAQSMDGKHTHTKTMIQNL